MIRRRDDGGEQQNRITDADEKVEEFPGQRLSTFAVLEGAAEDAGVVDPGAADDEGVGEVDAWHGGERVDVFAAHPDGLGVVATDGVEEAVFFGEKTWRHAGV